jgi:hypothetical protein
MPMFRLRFTSHSVTQAIRDLRAIGLDYSVSVDSPADKLGDAVAILKRRGIEPEIAMVADDTVASRGNGKLRTMQALTFINNLKVPVTSATLSKSTGQSTTAAGQMLSYMAKDRLLKRVGIGKYVMAPAGKKALAATTEKV